MLNIISRAWSRPEAGAVHKVARNLVAGLERIGCSFVLNRRLDYCSRIWIHDDYRAIMALPKERNGLKPLIGPNLFVMPRDIPWSVPIPSYCVYLHPSQWAGQCWTSLGYQRTPIDSWPVGIDTKTFEQFKQLRRTKVLFYYKCRDKPGEHGAGRIEKILRKSDCEVVRFDYGHYRQEDYLKALGECRYAVWYGRQESQGLALQEALAMGCPIIVIDVKAVGDCDGAGYQFRPEEAVLPATSAPYFDERCGLIIRDIGELPGAIQALESNYAGYSPESFVRECLSIEGCAKDLLDKFDKWWPGEPDFAAGDAAEALPFVPPAQWMLAALELRLRSQGINGVLPRVLRRS